MPAARPCPGGRAVSSTLRAVLDRQVREADMQQTLMDAARLGGWLAYHAFDSRRSPEGYPDIVAIRGGEMVAWELKTVQGRTTAAQEAWLAGFRAFGEAHGLGRWLDVRVVRPSDMAECIERLTGGRVL
jgi:Holliday junction resolvase